MELDMVDLAYLREYLKIPEVHPTELGNISQRSALTFEEYLSSTWQGSCSPAPCDDSRSFFENRTNRLIAAVHRPGSVESLDGRWPNFVEIPGAFGGSMFANVSLCTHIGRTP